MHDPVPSRRVRRVRYDLRRREVEVAGREDLSPGFTSVTFRGDTLGDFSSESFDDHVKFMFETGGPEPTRRDYTPRRFDRSARELTIEFALHGHGLASEWARGAVVGQRASIGGPRGSMIVPTDFDWHLLAGDPSALPAVRRRLEELPAGSRAIVVLDVPAEDRLPLATSADLEVHWVDDAPALLEAMHSLPLPAGDGFAWAAGEAAQMSELRRILLHGRGIPKENMRVAAYWKRGASAHHENLE